MENLAGVRHSAHAALLRKRAGSVNAIDVAYLLFLCTDTGEEHRAADLSGRIEFIVTSHH